MSQARQDASPASPAATELPPLSFPKDKTGSLEFTMEEIKGIIAAATNKDPLISKVGQVLAQYSEHLPHVGAAIKAAAADDSKNVKENADASAIAEKLGWLFNRLPKGEQLKEADRLYIFSIVNELIKRATATLVERFKKLTQDRSSDLAREVIVVLSSLQREEAGKDIAHKLIKQRIGEPSEDNLASACIALADIFFTARAIGACDRQAVNIEKDLFAAGKDEVKSSQGDKKSETKEVPKSYQYQSFLQEINLLDSKGITDSKISNDLLTTKQLLLGIKDIVFKNKCDQKEYDNIFDIYKFVREMINLINAELTAKGANEILIHQLISLLNIAFSIQNDLIRLHSVCDFKFSREDYIKQTEINQLNLLQEVYRSREPRPDALPVDNSIIAPRLQLLRNQLTEINLQFAASKEKEISETVKNMVRTVSYIPGQKISAEYFFYLFQAMSLEVKVGTLSTRCLSSASSYHAMNNFLQLIMDGSPAAIEKYLRPGMPLLTIFDSNLALLLQTYAQDVMDYAAHGRNFFEHRKEDDYLQAKARLKSAMQNIWFFIRCMACIPRSRTQILQDSMFAFLVSQTFPDLFTDDSSHQGLDDYADIAYQKLEEEMRRFDQAAMVKHEATTWPQLEDAMAKQDTLDMQQQAYLKHIEAKVIARMEEIEAEQKAEANFHGLVKQANQQEASARSRAKQKAAKAKKLQEKKEEHARIKEKQKAVEEKQQELKSGDKKLIQQEVKAKAVYDPESVQGKLYDEAGQFLRRNEYSKAKSLYDQAIAAANKDHVIVVCSYVELAECKLREADNDLRTIKGKILTTSSEDALATIKRISNAYHEASSLVQIAIDHCGNHLATDSHVSPEQLQHIEASTRFIRAKLESSAAVNYEPVLMPEVSGEDLPSERHQFCMTLEKPEESKEFTPALFYRVMSPRGEVINGVIDNAELKQCFGGKYQDFLNAVASQNQSELKSFLNCDLLKITAKRGHTFKGLLSNAMEWLDKLIKEDEADEQKLEQSKVEARKRLGVHAWKHKYKKVVLLPDDCKQRPSDVAPGVIALRKSGPKITAYFKKYQTMVSETLDIRDMPPGLSGSFSNASQDKTDDKFVMGVASAFYCLSKEHYLNKKIKTRKVLAKLILSSLEKTHHMLAAPIDDLRLLHSYTEPKLITAPDPKDEGEQKAVIIYRPDQVPAAAPASRSFADGLQLLREKKLKKAMAAAPPVFQLAAPPVDPGAEIKVEKAPAATPAISASKAKAALFSVSASPASAPGPTPEAESKREKLPFSPGAGTLVPATAGRPESPKP